MSVVPLTPESQLERLVSSISPIETPRILRRFDLCSSIPVYRSPLVPCSARSCGLGLCSFRGRSTLYEAPVRV